MTPTMYKYTIEAPVWIDGCEMQSSSDGFTIILFLLVLNGMAFGFGWFARMVKKEFNQQERTQNDDRK